MPVFSNFIGSKAEPVDLGHGLWNGVLPCDPFTAAGLPQNAGEADFSYGDYFSAARAFLEQDDCRNLKTALNRVLGRNISAAEIEAVNLHLVKHGKYYHPARVAVHTLGREIVFVLNMAVSGDGLKIIEKEFQNLKRLTSELSFTFLPDVYVFGTASANNGSTVKMFLGQWFDEYHEFHLTTPSSADPDRRCVGVWNKANTTLDDSQVSDLIRQSSMILTCYYNPITFEQIFPWHHGAGDFVVKLETGQVSVRLITVRGYAPLYYGAVESNPEDFNLEEVLEAVLLFLIQLSVRVRMDRADGIGAFILYKENTLPAMVEGFFQGLNLAARAREYPDDFAVAVKAYLSAASPQALTDLLEAYVARFNRTTGSKVLNDLNQKRHVHVLHAALQENFADK